MRDITLAKLKAKFHPDLTQTQFAEFLGFDLTTVNKIMHGTYNCSLRSRVWKELKEHVRVHYGYMLISEQKTDREKERLDKTVYELQRELDRKNREIKELTEVIEELTSSFRVMVGAKQSLEKGKFILSSYKKQAKEE